MSKKARHDHDDDDDDFTVETGADRQRELDRWNKMDVGVRHYGKSITLPAQPSEMPLDAAISALERKREAELQEYEVHEIVKGYPFDSLVALYRAMVETFGWADASSRKINSFFGSFDVKPDLLSVRVGPNQGDVIQVPTGQFMLPGVNRPVFMGAGPDGAHLSTEVNKAGRQVILDLCELAREKLKTSSIYQGKAMRMAVDKKGNLQTGFEPIFIPTDHIRPEELVLPDMTRSQVEVSVFTPITRTKACRDAKIPLKRGVLLEGPYGTGKTMTAAVVSKLCVENGWTFISLDNALGLKAALEFAARYQPAVVFCEDIDRTTSERTEAANDLLNTIDGVLSKGSEVMTILTTNHVENINKAMLRPGRLDAVISITPPDAKAVERLIRLYGRNLVPADVDLTEIGAELAGQIPATVREVVERAKLAMIARDADYLVANDLLIAAKTMARHRELLFEGAKDASSIEEQAGRAFANLIAQHSNSHDNDALKELHKFVKENS